MKKILVFGLAIIMSLLPILPAEAATMAQMMKGKILLQVEANGEAWYVYPGDLHRYYLGRPADAFNIMRQLGYGISNSDLMKIPVAASNMVGVDRDGDGMKVEIESSFGTSDLDADSDNDGFNDYEEVFFGYSPTNSSRVKVTDEKFARSQAGKILLQVQAHGEAWYVDTIANNRHYLGRPADAFEVMRNLGLGITNYNLSLIPVAGSLTAPVSWQTLSQNANRHSYTFKCPSDWTVDYASDYGGGMTLTQCNKIYAGQMAVDDGIVVSIGYVTDDWASQYTVGNDNYSYLVLQNVLTQDNVSQYVSNSFEGAYAKDNAQNTFNFLARRDIGDGFIEVKAVAYGGTQTGTQYFQTVNSIINSFVISQ